MYTVDVQVHVCVFVDQCVCMESDGCKNSAVYLKNSSFCAFERLVDTYTYMYMYSVYMYTRTWILSHNESNLWVITLGNNYTLFYSGLEDQLLGIVVAEERPDLEEAKNALIVSNAKMKQELKEIEDQILYRLSVSEGNPVDDEDLIRVLQASKLKSQEIKVLYSDTTWSWPL